MVDLGPIMAHWYGTEQGGHGGTSRQMLDRQMLTLQRLILVGGDIERWQMLMLTGLLLMGTDVDGTDADWTDVDIDRC